jgi:hypothetical protein
MRTSVFRHVVRVAFLRNALWIIAPGSPLHNFIPLHEWMVRGLHILGSNVVAQPVMAVT